jgi:hypothetical protein
LKSIKIFNPDEEGMPNVKAQNSNEGKPMTKSQSPK